jgi:hypothetical protein
MTPLQKTSSNSDTTSAHSKAGHSRRDFFRKTAAVGTVASTPYIWSSSVAKAEDANSNKTIACIGIGGSRGRYNRGRTIANQAAKLGQMIAVCDCDQVHNEEYNKNFDGSCRSSPIIASCLIP